MRDRIEDAVAVGQRNQKALELLHNWCGHVQPRRHGGVGMVEAATGLPIGHFFLECPYAPAGGMAAFELTETALDFYDRNCVGCKHRKAMGFPNLSVLLAERDARRAQQRAERERAQHEREQRFGARDTARQRIRPSLDAVAATTLDRIAELDRQEEGAAQRLVETAKLAPETFTPEIIGHLFELIGSQEHWLVGPCLEAVSYLPVDGSRLCNAALAAMRSFGHGEIGGAIVGKHGAQADPSLIADALPSIVSLANPAQIRFGPGLHREPVPGPLMELYRHHKDAVRAGIRQMLEQKRPYIAQLAARGLEALIPHDKTLASFLVPELIAKLVRSNHLLEGRDDEIEDALNDIRDVLVLSFTSDPDKVDQLIQDFLVGASDEGAAELYRIFDEVLRDVRFGRDRTEPPPITPAHDVAFRRLVVAASEARSHEVERATTGFFHGEPYDLAPLAAKHIDLLLGTAAVLEARLTHLREQPLDKKSPDAGMERQGKLQHLANISEALVRWACLSAAKTGLGSVKSVLEFLRALPEGSDRLTGSIIGNFHAMMRTPEGLIACLPDFYSAQVGSSQLVRSCSATSFGEMQRAARNNLPSLAFEAFCAQLNDPYVIVHQTAIRALDRFTLPEEFVATAKSALASFILYYAKEKPREEFLVKAIDLYVRRYATEADMAGAMGMLFIGMLKKGLPYVVAGEIKYGRNAYQRAPGYASLLILLFDDRDAVSIYGEDLVERIGDLSPEIVREERGALLSLGKKTAMQRPHLVAILIEGFTRAKLWEDALDLSRAVYQGIENSIRTTPVRLQMSLWMLACEFEEAIGKNDADRTEQAGKEFLAALTAIEEDNAANRERRDPLRGLSGTH
jgi:hypothetical protein